MENLNEFKLNVLNNAEHDLSSRYKLISTNRVLDKFIERGFYVASVSLNQKNIKTAHAVRLRHDTLKIDDDFIEVVIINSYNGTTCFSINLGVFRLVCSNGLVAGKSLFKQSYKHIGDKFYGLVDNAINLILNNTQDLIKVVSLFKYRILTDTEKYQLAEHLFNERLRKNKQLLFIDLEKSLRPKRVEDNNNTLWSVFNLIQEKIINGGIVYSTLEGDVENQESTWAYVNENQYSRQIKSIQERDNLNCFIFDETLKLVA
jgi:hypothetical protein